MNTLKLILGLGGLAEPNQATMATAHTLSDSHTIWLNSPHPHDAATSHPNHLYTHIDFPAFDGAALQANARERGMNIPLFTPTVCATSRRVARWYFWQHQALLWSACDEVIAKRPVNTLVQFMLLIDAGDHLASSLYVDCLYQIRQRYPQVSCHLVLLMPHPEHEDVLLKARAGALMAELNALGQRTWQPSDLHTKQAYVLSQPLWDSAHVHGLPQYPEISTDYYQLLAHVQALIAPKSSEHPLQAAWQDEQNKRHSKPKEPRLPRMVSSMQVSLQLNMGRLHLALQQHVQAHLLQALADAEHQAPTATLDVVAQAWALDEQALLLNVASGDGNTPAPEPIVKEWQKRGDFFIQQARPHDGAWDEQMRNLHANFQKVYEKHFRGMGAELYYSLSQTRMENWVAQHMLKVEHTMWSQCLSGKVSVAVLLNHFADIHSHYRQLQEHYEIEQRRLVQAIDERRKHWHTIMQSWEAAPKRDRAKLQQEYHLNFMNQLLVEWFTWQCEYKAVSFALYFIQSLLPEYQHIQASLQHITAMWQKAATKQQQLAHGTWVEQQQQWLQQVGVENSHQYLLQPDASMLQDLLQTWQTQAPTWLHEVTSTWMRRLGNFATFEQWQLWLQQGQWQSLTARIAQDCSRQLIQEQCTPAFLQAAFAKRVAILSNMQWQQLCKHATDTLSRLYQRNIQPLGKVLSEFSAQQACVTVLYPAALETSEAVTQLLEAATQRSPAPVQGRLSTCAERIEILLTSTCYLPEWYGHAALSAAYRSCTQEDKSLWYWHVDGEIPVLREALFVAEARNRDLIRQQLLLAQVFNHLYFCKDHYNLNLADGESDISIAANHLAELVERIPLTLVRKVLLRNRALRDGQNMPALKYMHKQLDMILADFRQHILPAGVDLADADWKDAGRYVVWVRAVQHIKQYWLPQTAKETAVSASS
ncbi:hypothetical protein LVJ82_07870 [Vitreoscilla massiliensis]|uniref:Uncharacterized protein n=1 Tax=Vitreoscilla massiliensis TaxID=1689272 RepID=A0ABY4EBT8_9NEIS|nr:hypothetical protein [Vitreoscilla massiliensis]UOO90867.1 hypothetical protein LVJ82_07870 [Vitreoscilla massiliensis]